MCCFYEAKTIRLNKAKFPKEPTEAIDIHVIRQASSGESCPICGGNGFLLCAGCEDGRVAFLGGLQECGACAGTGVKSCQVCESLGQIPLKSIPEMKADANKKAPLAIS